MDIRNWQLVVFSLALALPLMAIAKVMIDHFKAEGTPRETTMA